MPEKYFTLLVVTYKYLIIKKNIKKRNNTDKYPWAAIITVNWKNKASRLSKWKKANKQQVPVRNIFLLPKQQACLSSLDTSSNTMEVLPDLSCQSRLTLTSS